MKHIKYAAIALACALTACGGGGGNSGNTKTEVTSVKVVGASLADSGTFGYKFTVQPNTYPLVYPERVASTFGVPSLCKAYVYNTSASATTATEYVANFSANSAQTGCTNHAVAGASLGNYSTDFHTYLSSTSPTSMLTQLTNLGNSAGSGFTSADLFIVGEGAANDMATLATAFLTYAQSQTDLTNLMTSAQGLAILGLPLGDTSTANTVAYLMQTQTGRGQLVGRYMVRLAGILASSINTNLLSHGASKVAVLNLLDVTLTPKFQATLSQLRALEAYDPTNYPAGTADTVQATVRAWTQAFNTQLATSVAALPGGKVVIVDFYQSFSDEMADPAQYGLTNVSNTVCDELVNLGVTTTTSTISTLATSGVTTLKTPSTVGACSAANPAMTQQLLTKFGNTTWLQKYLFADNFHPTPYGHQLLAQLVAKRLAEAGWL